MRKLNVFLLGLMFLLLTVGPTTVSANKSTHSFAINDDISYVYVPTSEPGIYFIVQVGTFGNTVEIFGTGNPPSIYLIVSGDFLLGRIVNCTNVEVWIPGADGAPGRIITVSDGIYF